MCDKFSYVLYMFPRSADQWIYLNDDLRCSVRLGGWVMASSPCATTVLAGGGRRKKATVTGKSKDYRWVKKVNKGNMSNVKINGPFGEACTILQIKNTKTNRKRLQTHFIRFHKHKLFHCVSSDGSPTISSENVCSKPSRVASPKNQNIKVRYSLLNPGFYCVCQSEDWRANGLMVECEECSQWFHYKCIIQGPFKFNKHFSNDKLIKFTCALNGCSSAKSRLEINKKVFQLISKTELSPPLTTTTQTPTTLHTSQTQTPAPPPQTPPPSPLPPTTPPTPPPTTTTITPPPPSPPTTTLTPPITTTLSPPSIKLTTPSKTPIKPLATHTTKTVDKNNYQPIKCIQEGDTSPLNISDAPHVQVVSDEDATNKDLIPYSTISKILNYNINSKFFEYSLKKNHFTHHFDENIFNSLLKSSKNRRFARNTWQSHFIDLIKKNNPYCVFYFKNHCVSAATLRSRKTGSPLFQAHAGCKFTDCTCEVTIKMHSKTLVSCFFTGFIKHNINKNHSRHISGEERQTLKNKIKYGPKPMHIYNDEFSKISNDILISGNYGSLGPNSKKLQQIAVEGRQEGRLDKDAIMSLLQQEKDMSKEHGGFIQKICISPFYVLYWNINSLQYYHDFSKSQILFWDATGSLIKTGKNEKSFLYYELAIKNLNEKQAAIPLTAMVSNSHSLPTILDWIRNFIHAEKKKFGYKNFIKYPKLIISDQSMVLILAALKEWNDESLDDFLLRAYMIVTGKANKHETEKTLVHLCKSHYLNTTKRFLKKKEVSSKKISFCLYTIGLLMSCENLQDFRELVFDICVTMSSKYINNTNQVFITRLINKINSFSSSSECQIDVSENISLEELNPNKLTEEEYVIQNPSSPFKLLAHQINDLALKHQGNQESSEHANDHNCTVFLQYLLNKALPLYPLWSSILLGDLSRFNLLYTRNTVAETLTNSYIENRFRQLKHIELNGRSKHRIDEFSHNLNNHFKNVHRKIALDILKPKLNTRKRKCAKDTLNPNMTPVKLRKTQILVEETWAKKSPKIEVTQIGKYQGPPKKKIKIDVPVTSTTDQKKTDLNSENIDHYYYTNKRDSSKIHLPKTQPKMEEISRLINLGYTCWLNSFLQGYFYSNLLFQVLKLKDNSIYLESYDKDLINVIGDMWHYMASNAGATVPKDLITNTVDKVCSIVNINKDEQQDPHEFFTNFMSSLNDSYLKIMKGYSSVCGLCNNSNLTSVDKENDIILRLNSKNKKSNIKDLLTDHFKNTELIQSYCGSCKSTCEHVRQEKIISLPDVVTIVLSRSSLKDGVSVKLNNDIYPSDTITLETVAGESFDYELKSILCHEGIGTSSGHYTTAIRSGNSFICCNDDKVCLADIKKISKTSYMLVYNRKIEPISDTCINLINSVISTEAFKNALNDPKFPDIRPYNKFLCLSLKTKGVSESSAPFIELELNPYLKNSAFLSWEKLFTLIIDMLFPDSCSNSLLLKKEYFEISYVHIICCPTCKWDKHIESGLKISSLSHFDLNSFEESIKLQEHRIVGKNRCSTCDTYNFSSSLIYSMPSSLAFSVQQPNFLNFSSFELDFSQKLVWLIPVKNHVYSLSLIMFEKNGDFGLMVIKKNKFFDFTSGKEFFFDDFKNLKFERLLLIYNTQPKCTVSDDVLQEDTFNDLCLPKILFDVKNQPDKDFSRQVNGITVNNAFCKEILPETAWLNSNHINVFLHILSSMSLKKVKVVDCGWASTYLFKKGNPKDIIWFFHAFESKTKWLSQDYIIIPVNENQNHWTVIVIDVQHKRIIYSNSYGCSENSKYIIFQIWRYFYFECVFHSSFLLPDENHWKVVYYHKNNFFPKQTDSSSCGVYVCATVYCILFSHSMPVASNLKEFRKYIVRMISNYCLHQCC